LHAGDRCALALELGGQRGTLQQQLILPLRELVVSLHECGQLLS
jgi:hypothetical protein